MVRIIKENGKILIQSLLIFLFSFLIKKIHAHSLLMQPHPYGIGCKGCATCPPYYNLNSNGTPFTWNNVTSWGRGETVQVRWEKNNHNGGFVRLSLLPLSQMFNQSAHSNLAFYFTCWEHGSYLCATKICGTDAHGVAFSRNITVPTVIPDGEYILGFMWFGGLHWRRSFGRFADYTSCARVRISGGMNLGDRYIPKFYPGPGGNFDHSGSCLTSATSPGECTHGCRHVNAIYGVPRRFSLGRTPSSLKPSDFMTRKSVTLSAQNNNGTPWQQDHGICKGDVCCASTCLACTQKACQYRTGGKGLCCPDVIRLKDRKCGPFGAPCIIYN